VPVAVVSLDLDLVIVTVFRIAGEASEHVGADVEGLPSATS